MDICEAACSDLPDKLTEELELRVKAGFTLAEALDHFVDELIEAAQAGTKTKAQWLNGHWI